uniref:OTU domain-containing protein n=1 Tax=Rhabditophanes sp. KR3021 TaxID=114890 RepID=A0AC35TNA8_9BILA
MKEIKNNKRNHGSLMNSSSNISTGSLGVSAPKKQNLTSATLTRQMSSKTLMIPWMYLEKMIYRKYQPKFRLIVNISVTNRELIQFIADNGNDTKADLLRTIIVGYNLMEEHFENDRKHLSLALVAFEKENRKVHRTYRKNGNEKPFNDYLFAVNEKFTKFLKERIQRESAKIINKAYDTQIRNSENFLVPVACEMLSEVIDSQILVVFMENKESTIIEDYQIWNQKFSNHIKFNYDNVIDVGVHFHFKAETIKIVGDGNCMFNAISTAFYGDMKSQANIRKDLIVEINKITNRAKEGNFLK